MFKKVKDFLKLTLKDLCIIPYSVEDLQTIGKSFESAPDKELIKAYDKWKEVSVQVVYDVWHKFSALTEKKASDYVPIFNVFRYSPKGSLVRIKAFDKVLDLMTTERVSAYIICQIDTNADDSLTQEECDIIKDHYNKAALREIGEITDLESLKAFKGDGWHAKTQKAECAYKSKKQDIFIEEGLKANSFKRMLELCQTCFEEYKPEIEIYTRMALIEEKIDQAKVRFEAIQIEKHFCDCEDDRTNFIIEVVSLNNELEKEYEKMCDQLVERKIQMILENLFGPHPEQEQ